MSWFDSSFSFAKSALSQAQKSIDRVLDIDDGKKGQEEVTPRQEIETKTSLTTNDSFSSTWGVLSPQTDKSTPQKKSNRTPRAGSNRSTANVKKSVSTPVTSTPTANNETSPVLTSTPISDTSFVNKKTKEESFDKFNHVNGKEQVMSSQSLISIDAVPNKNSNVEMLNKFEHSLRKPVEEVDKPVDQVNEDNKLEPIVQVDKRVDKPNQLQILQVDQVKEVNKPVDQVKEVDKPVHQVKEIDKPVDQVKEIDKPVHQVIEIDKPVHQVIEIDKPVDQVKEIDKPVDQVKEIDKPVHQVIEIDKPVDQVKEIDKPVDQVIEIDKPVDQVKELDKKLVQKFSGQKQEPVEQVNIFEEDKGNTKDDVAIADKTNKNNKKHKESKNIEKLSEVEKQSSLSGEETFKQLTLELTQTKKMLDIRESKLMELSHDNMSCHENNLELQKCVRELQKELDNIRQTNNNLTEQIERLEKKLQVTTTERDGLKKQVQLLEKENSIKKDVNEQKTAEALREKDRQIAELMAEGEKLSKQELQFNNTIKKLRVKDKQSEQLITSQKQQIEDVENEVKRLKDVVKKKDENEKKYQDSLSQLNNISEQQAKDLTLLKPEKDELLEKVRSLQSNLDSAYKELSELRMENALTKTAIEEATLSAKQNVKDELKKELDGQRMKSEKDKDALMMQINELRMSLSRTEQQATWKEDQLRQEIADLHKRLQESESRNQDLSDTISNATRPLLRQIDHLQSAHSAQASNWEKVETSLTQRLIESQSQMNEAIDKERVAVEKEMTLQSRVTGLENQVQSLRQERAQLAAALEMEKTKLQTLEETYQRDTSRHEVLKSSLQQTNEELKKEKEMVERQLEYERVRLEAESRKATLELQEKEKLRNQLSLSLSLTSPPENNTVQQNVNDVFKRSISQSSDGLTDFSIRFGNNGGTLSSSSIIEHLQSALKQKEGELTSAQNMVASLERSRTGLTEDLALLSEKNQQLEERVKIIPQLQEKLAEMTQKHEALLQMFGEKAEEAEELKMDIEDLKIMYRQQIEILLSRNN